MSEDKLMTKPGPVLPGKGQDGQVKVVYRSEYKLTKSNLL